MAVVRNVFCGFDHGEFNEEMFFLQRAGARKDERKKEGQKLVLGGSLGKVIYLAPLNEPISSSDHLVWRGVVEGIGDDARCHDSDVAIKEVRVDGKGSDERDCGRLLRKILGHVVALFL